MGGEGKEEFKQELLNESLRNILTPKSTRSYGYIVVLRLNLGFFVRRKRIEREEKDAINNNRTVLLYCLTTVRKGSTILPVGLTPAKILTGYRAIPTTITHMVWAKLLGHGPIQSKDFLIQPCGRKTTKK